MIDILKVAQRCRIFKTEGPRHLTKNCIRVAGIWQNLKLCSESCLGGVGGVGEGDCNTWN